MVRERDDFIMKHVIMQSKTDKVFDRVNLIICLFLLILFVYLLYFVVIASYSDPYAIW